MSCAVDGCDKPIKSCGFCCAHYKRFWRHGSPTAGQTSKGEPKRFLHSLVGTESAGCIPWPYARDYRTGYAMVSHEGRMQAAARVVCIMVNGPPPTSRHEAAHNCGKGNEGCVNPHHLRWATHQENQADRLDHGTDNRGDKKRSFTKLNEESVKAIRAMAKTGSNHAELSEIYGVSRSNISAICLRRNWAWVE